MDLSSLKITQLTRELEEARRRIGLLEQARDLPDSEAGGQRRDLTPRQNDRDSLLSLINSSEDLIWFVDCDRRILLANDATRAVFHGLRKIDIVSGMFSRDFLPETEAVFFDQLFKTALRGKTLRFDHTGFNGKQYAVTVKPVRTAGDIIGVSVFARDITKLQELQEELRSFEYIIASTPDLIALLDENYRYRVANEAYLKAFAMTNGELLGKTMKELWGKRHFETYSEPHLRKAFAGELVKFECWLELPARGRRFMSITYHPLNNRDLKPRHIVINAHDITELKQAEDERQRVFDVSLDLIAIISFEGAFIKLNPAWSRTLGWSTDELKSRTWLDLIAECDRNNSIRASRPLLRGESVTGFENRCLCRDGSLRWLSWSSYPDMKQRLVYTTGRDITNRRRMEDELRQLATTDPLTGASNRRHFIEQAAEELDRSRRYGFRIAMLMLDIDHFKTINDNHGHNVGDEVLKSIVACCHRELRSSDLFGRFGGEEFAAVLVETNREAAENTCRRLLRAIAGLAIGTPRGEVAVTVSIGLTLLAADDRSLDPLLKRADDALYEAKRSGRNRVVCL